MFQKLERRVRESRVVEVLSDAELKIDTKTDFSDRAVSETAHRHRADGVICGHVHRPEQRLIGPIWYINDGDWVSSCTAVAESRNGVLALLRWDRARSRRAGCEPAVPEATLS